VCIRLFASHASEIKGRFRRTQILVKHVRPFCAIKHHPRMRTIDDYQMHANEARLDANTTEREPYKQQKESHSTQTNFLQHALPFYASKHYPRVLAKKTRSLTREAYASGLGKTNGWGVLYPITPSPPPPLFSVNDSVSLLNRGASRSYSHVRWLSSQQQCDTRLRAQKQCA
jgi:hypothetical protein